MKYAAEFSYSSLYFQFAGDALLVIFYDEVSSWAKGSDEQLSKRALKVKKN